MSTRIYESGYLELKKRVELLLNHKKRHG